VKAHAAGATRRATGTARARGRHAALAARDRGQRAVDQVGGSLRHQPARWAGAGAGALAAATALTVAAVAWRRRRRQTRLTRARRAVAARLHR
jgi:hypothetical protein